MDSAPMWISKWIPGFLLFFRLDVWNFKSVYIEHDITPLSICFSSHTSKISEGVKVYQLRNNIMLQYYVLAFICTIGVSVLSE